MSDVAAEITVGSEAPDFTLKDQDQNDIKLSDYRGKKNVVLAFYPLDWSPVCTGENKCLTDDFPSFESANAAVMGIIGIHSGHQAWLIVLKRIEGRQVTGGHPKNPPHRSCSNTPEDEGGDEDNSKPRPVFKP